MAQWFLALLLLTALFGSALAADTGFEARRTFMAPASYDVNSAPVTTSDIRSGLSLGVGYPYVGVKYFFNNDYGAEFRFDNGSGINVYALRGYWSFLKFNSVSLYAGMEGGYITFNTPNVDNTYTLNGGGFEISPFAGAEYFLSRDLSMMFDFSLPYINLTSNNTTLGSLQWVINGGVYVYPF